MECKSEIGSDKSRSEKCVSADDSLNLTKIFDRLVSSNGKIQDQEIGLAIQKDEPYNRVERLFLAALQVHRNDFESLGGQDNSWLSDGISKKSFATFAQVANSSLLKVPIVFDGKEMGRKFQGRLGEVANPQTDAHSNVRGEQQVNRDTKSDSLTNSNSAAKPDAKDVLLVEKMLSTMLNVEGFQSQVFFPDHLGFQTKGKELFLPEAVRQGRIGNCYFAAALISVASQQPGLLRQSVSQIDAQTYRVKFAGRPNKEFDVTKPSQTEMALYHGAASSGNWSRAVGSWPLIFQQAQGLDRKAQTFSERNQFMSYSGNLPGEFSDNGGFPYEGLELLTGKKFETLSLSHVKEPEKLGKLIEKSLESGAPMVASTLYSEKTGQSTPDGFNRNHAYAVIDFRADGPHEYVTLRDPHGPEATREVDLATFSKNFSALSHELKDGENRCDFRYREKLTMVFGAGLLAAIPTFRIGNALGRVASGLLGRGTFGELLRGGIIGGSIPLGFLGGSVLAVNAMDSHETTCTSSRLSARMLAAN